MSNIIPFESTAGLPSFMAAGQGNLSTLVSGASHPSISIKGKVFTLIKEGTKTLITKPDGDGEPASSIEVVILDIGPHSNKSARIFYNKGYEEGSTEKPDCYSDDGVAPAADASNPQCNKCALCPKNVKGSKATVQNPEGKACASAKRLAVATPDNLDDPMLIRAPGASIVPLLDYLKVLKARSVPDTFCVVTKIGFNYGVAHPELTFKPVGFVTEAQYAQAKEVSKQELVQEIVGVTTPVIAEDAALPAPEVKAAPAPVAKAEAPVTKKTKVIVEGEDDLPATPIAEPAKPAKAAKPAPTPKPEPVQEAPKTVSVDEGLSATLDDLDFDD